VIGHAGYEYNRRRFIDTWFLRTFINTPTAHAMHHEKIRGNYGLYFNFWDRLMGTNHEEYERRFREVTSRPRHCGGSLAELSRTSAANSPEAL
jgi:sterol desaturase/sphingolipid hydroxylase (fatty acid hydroxylase superfamily)